MERIAIETEEDFQKLIKTLESFDVEVLRPNIGSYFEHLCGSKIQPPPVMPRDYTAMIGTRFFIDKIQGIYDHYGHICQKISSEGNSIEYDEKINTATIIPLGINLYSSGPQADPWDRDIWNVIRKSSWPSEIPKEHIFKLPPSMKFHPKAIMHRDQMMSNYHRKVKELFPNHGVSCFDIADHLDGCFCPIKPGLVIGLDGLSELALAFPGWEILYQNKDLLQSRIEYTHLRARNNGRWWLPEHDIGEDFIEFVDGYLDCWVGFVEETVFDVNILMIDQNHAVCTNFNDDTLKALSRHGVDAIPVEFRHRYFWDGGIHCITSDIHRQGPQIDLGLPIISP